MAWKHIARVRHELRQLDRGKLEAIETLHAAHRFLYGAFPREGRVPNPAYAQCIALSDYGRKLLESADIGGEEVPPGAIELAALQVFYHNDILLDIERSNASVVIETLADDLRNGAYIWPHKYGRLAYDNYNDIFGSVKLEHLEPIQVDAVFSGLGNGVYQIGTWVLGPLGILRSAAKRFLPPTRKAPLWHCSDLGCVHVHHVNMLRHDNACEQIEAALIKSAEKIEGPPSPWDRPYDSLHRDESYNKGQTYTDIGPFLFQSLSKGELISLVSKVIHGEGGQQIRGILSRVYGKAYVQTDAQQLAGKLDVNAAIHILLTRDNAELVSIIDHSVYAKEIKIPSAEIRQGKFRPTPLSPYDGICQLSSLGMRSVRASPTVHMSRLIWKSYEQEDLRSDLAWRCKSNSSAFDIGMVVDYVRFNGPQEAVRELIMPSRPIFERLQKDLWFETSSSLSTDDTVDRILWKLGFNPPRYDTTLDLLKSHLAEFRESVLTAGQQLMDRQRADIRASGVNVFVLLEKVLEDIISFNVWVLASDHFMERFNYHPEAALRRVVDVIVPPSPENDAHLVWNPSGGNTLGVLLAFGRAAASWMKSLPGSDRAALERPTTELPHYVAEEMRRFPFIHRQFWADLDIGPLQEFAREFSGLIGQFEQSRLAEIRNGLDHYREEDQFPSQELLLACESRISSALEAADVKGIFPKTVWITEATQNQHGDATYVLMDYKGRRVQVNRPSVLSGLLTPELNQAYVCPYGHLLNVSTGELLFKLKSRSDYANMWVGYPRLTTRVVPPLGLDHGSAEATSSGEVAGNELGTS